MRPTVTPVSKSAAATVRLRKATLDDLDALLELEHQSFSGDRLSRRQLRYLISRARAVTLLVESGAGELLRDPWAARNDYISVLLDPKAAREEFLHRRGSERSSHAQRRNQMP